ncbi:MAG: hypothetical protein AB1815_03355 [Bacillota bacterium]
MLKLFDTNTLKQVNRGATYPDGRKVAGRNFVARPDGRSLLQADQKPGHYHFTPDSKLIDRVRRRWPYLSDVRERARDLEDLLGCTNKAKSPCSK